MKKHSMSAVSFAESHTHARVDAFVNDCGIPDAFSQRTTNIYFSLFRLVFALFFPHFRSVGSGRCAILTYQSPAFDI